MSRILSFFLLVSLVSCYRMPDESCMSTVPMTNNPLVIPQKGGGASDWVPGMKY